MSELSKRQSNPLLKPFVPGLVLVSVMWLVMLAQWIFPLNLSTWGIFPRSWSGLAGIFIAPLVHGGLDHLLSNSIPLLLLSGGIFYFYPKLAWRVFLLSYVLPGMYVWIAARPSYHIGASGVVYALAFFLVFSGIFRKNIISLTLSMAVIVLYGGIVWGILPMDPGVSWESHLYGAIVGIVLAFYFRKQGGPPRKSYPWETEPDDETETGWWDYRKQFPPPPGFNS